MHQGSPEFEPATTATALASVIVCTFRREQVLIDTLRRLVEGNRGGHEILVIDQEPAHEASTRAALDGMVRDGHVRIVVLDKPGLTRARNVGAAEARHEILLFCDDDIIPGDDLIARHLACYADAGVAAVAGQVLENGETPGHRPGHYSHDGFVPAFHGLYGANFSIRRSVYRSIGGSDEQLGVHAYTEDVILAHKLRQSGHRIVFEPRASVRHLKADRGGCRITDRAQPTAEWEKSYSKLYWMFLDPDQPRAARLGTLREALRQGPLRRQNVAAPWRQPLAWIGFAKAAWKARRSAAESNRKPSGEAAADPTDLS